MAKILGHLRSREASATSQAREPTVTAGRGSSLLVGMYFQD